jgi:hypothetical protein
MVLAFRGPYIADGTGQVVFFLIVLFWIIGGLLKKASEASKRSTPPAPLRPPRPEAGSAPQPGAPTLSDFLKRIREMSQQAKKPGPPPRIEPERPSPAPVMRRPLPPLRPTIPRKPPVRPAVVPAPSLKRPEKRQKLVEPTPLGALHVATEKAPEFQVSLSGLAGLPPEAPGRDAYQLAGPEEDQITQILGDAVSSSVLKKGIILSEILGPPRAMRPRRYLGLWR